MRTCRHFNVNVLALAVFTFTVAPESFCQEFDYNKIYGKSKDGRRDTSGVRNRERKPFLHWNICAAVPVGSYGSNVFAENAEFAQTGVDLSLSFFKPIYKFFHFSFSAGFIKNGSKLDQLVELNNASPTSTTTVNYFDFDGYRHFYLTTGLMASGRVEWIEFDLKAGFGIGFGFRSVYELEETDRMTSDRIATVVEKADDFAIMLPSVGFSARMFPAKKFFLSVNFDYKRIPYNFEDVRVDVSSGGVTQQYIGTIPVNAHVISTGIGMGVAF